VCIWPFSSERAAKIAYRFASSPSSKILVHLYAYLFGINKDEAEFPLYEYSSIQALFQRKLKTGIRPLDTERSAIVSPVDGVIVALGACAEDISIKVKGESYTANDLLGSKHGNHAYHNGSFLVIYMPPGDYHHVHSPFTGQVVAAKHIRGRNFPLFSSSHKYAPGIYRRNTRQVNYLIPEYSTYCDHSCAPVALIQVASALVGTIINRFDIEKVKEQRPSFAKGEELGYFTFGSTVILVFPPGNIMLTDALHSGQPIRVGQKIAEFIS